MFSVAACLRFSSNPAMSLKTQLGSTRLELRLNWGMREAESHPLRHLNHIPSGPEFSLANNVVEPLYTNLSLVRPHLCLE